MKIEEGKYYRRRDGKIVGPMERTSIADNPYAFCFNFYTYTDDGVYNRTKPTDWDLIEEVLAPDAKPPTPVRTVTRKEIVPGTYGPGGCLRVKSPLNDDIGFEIVGGEYTPSEVREFARLLNEIADAMEEQS